MSANRPRRAQRFAQRAHEQRELTRRRDEAVGIVDVDEARGRLLEHLISAKRAALEGRLVVVAGQINGLIREVERKP